jgi:hypothetical protein
MKKPDMKYPIGFRYKPQRKYTYVCTVLDYRFTYDSGGNLKFTRYVAAHDRLGQQVIDFEVVQATIDLAEHV